MKIKTLASLVASFAFAGMAHAITWNASTPGLGPIVFLDGTPNFYTSSLTLGGFNPALHNVTSATISFYFADDASDESEQVDITANGVQVANDVEVNGDHTDAPDSYHRLDYNLNATQLAALQDGIVDFT